MLLMQFSKANNDILSDYSLFRMICLDLELVYLVAYHGY